jgi:hypothetical protein
MPEMAFAVRTAGVASGGASSGTGNRTATFTPAVGDLVVVYCCVAANTNDTPTCSDNNGSGTYDLIDVMNASIASINYRMSVFIRTALMVNTTSTVITVATGSNTSGTIHVVPITGVSRTGSSAVRSKGSQNNQAAGTAAPVLNQSALTGNGTLVAQGSADTTTTPPTNWTEVLDTSQSNDTVALESASRASGFTGTTITFGAASSTVFCSHAMELDVSALLTRSVLVDGVGAIASAATFLSILSRTALVDAVGAVATAGQRALLRSSAVSATGDVSSAASFFSIANGSAAIDASGAIETSGESIAVLSRSASVDGTTDITVSGASFSVFDRATIIDGTVGIESSAVFFSIVQGTTSIDCMGAIEASGEIQVGAGEHERSASFSSIGTIVSSGLAILERAASLTTTSDISATGIFFRTIQGSASFSVTVAIDSAGQRDLLRSITFDCVGEVSVSGEFLSILESSGELSANGSIDSSGLVGDAAHERAILIDGQGGILASGIIIQIVHFAPRQVLSIGTASGILSIGNEVRSVTVEQDIQVGII